jgi:two-component system chemotaxis response regulator CheB
MSEVKVVKRWPRLRNMPASPQIREGVCGEASNQLKVVAIGASTGGPVAIQTILSGLNENFPLPVLIVQHMAAGFVRGFTEWLALSSRLPVHVAAQNEDVLPGHIYIAPDGFQMLLGSSGRIKLSIEPPVNGLCSLVSALFRSVADVLGKNAIGVLLTGMGKDGAEELLMMKRKGAVTIVQDEASSVI